MSQIRHTKKLYYEDMFYIDIFVYIQQQTYNKYNNKYTTLNAAKLIKNKII